MAATLPIRLRWRSTSLPAMGNPFRRSEPVTHAPIAERQPPSGESNSRGDTASDTAARNPGSEMVSPGRQRVDAPTPATHRGISTSSLSSTSKQKPGKPRKLKEKAVKTDPYANIDLSWAKDDAAKARDEATESANSMATRQGFNPFKGASDRRAPGQKDQEEEEPPELTVAESVLSRAMCEDKPHAGALASGWANRARLKAAEKVAAAKAAEAAAKAEEAAREAPKLLD